MADGEDRRCNLLLAGLTRDTPELRAQFVQGMTDKFKVPEAQVERILAQLPFVLSKNCTLEEARKLAEVVQSIGGVCRLKPADEEGEAAPPPPPAEEEAPAAEEAPGPEPGEPEGDLHSGKAPPPPVQSKRMEGDPSEGQDAPVEAEFGGSGLEFDPDKAGVDMSTIPVQAPAPEEDVTPEEEPADEMGNIPLATPGASPAKRKGTVGADQVQCMECGTVNAVTSDVCTNCFFPLPKKKK
jgi:hypothetical protein